MPLANHYPGSTPSSTLVRNSCHAVLVDGDAQTVPESLWLLCDFKRSQS
jgi:hypothetical protein